MQSKTTTIVAYIEEAPADRRACLTKLYDLYRKTLPGCVEDMAYGMPCFKRDGVMVAAFASQKNYVAVYVGEKAVLEHRDALKGAKFGKGCVRFADPKKINFAAVERLLASAEGC